MILFFFSIIIIIFLCSDASGHGLLSGGQKLYGSFAQSPSYNEIYGFLVLNFHLFLSMQGPEIRTGFLKDGKSIQLKEGQEITITTDYSIKGDPEMISMSYQKLAVDLKPGNTILCADGTITLTVLSCDPNSGTVRCRCENTATLGERKNVNLPGVVVDLPTLTEKDKEDILGWGVPNSIDMIALSFVRKGSDLVNVRKVLGPHAKHIMLMSKVSYSFRCFTYPKVN